MNGRSVGVGFVGSGSVVWAYLRALDVLVARGLAWPGPISVRRQEAWPEIMSRRPGAQIVPDAAAVIESDVDVVAILTPPSSHAEIALAALEAGKHVLVEKPLGITRAEAEAVVGLAADHGLYVMAAPFVLLSPTVQELWRLVGGNEIGTVHSARALYGNPGSTWARWYHESGVGPLGDLAVYNLKTLTALLGPVGEVLAAESTAVRPRVVGDMTMADPDPDTIHFVLRHRDGALSSVVASHAIQHYRRTAMELYGTTGTINLLGDDWAPAGHEVWRNDEGSWQLVEPADETWRWTDGLRELVFAVRDDRPPLQELGQDLHLIDVLAAAREAARTGTAVMVGSDFPAMAPPPAPPRREGHVHDRTRPVDEQF
jgi:predicted dehydrogenase